MRAVELLKPLVVFAVVIAVVLAGTAAVGITVSEDQEREPTPEGRTVEGQSPDAWRAENVIATSDGENGSIRMDADTDETKRVLVDTQHSNLFSRPDLEPILDALFRNGHEVRFKATTESNSGFGESSYNETLQQFDAVLVIAPTGEFSETEVAGLEAYARGGGRVVVLTEPSQNVLSSTGLFGATAVTRQYTGRKFLGEFGMQVGTGVLYNMDDANNDNNFKSIHARTTRSGGLATGVDTVTFDTAGRLVTTEQSRARPLLASVEGTTQLETRRTDDYTIGARNGNVVLVADASFIQSSELYDADNERFVGNLLDFLVTGDKPEDVPSAEEKEDEFGDGDGGGETPEPGGPPEETPTPTPAPTATPTPVA